MGSPGPPGQRHRRPYWAGIGDFNGDGKTDIAWYEPWNDNGVTVLLSNGANGFSLSKWANGIGKPDWAGKGSHPGQNGDGWPAPTVPSVRLLARGHRRGCQRCDYVASTTARRGAAVSSYKVTASPGGAVKTTASTGVTLNGLTNGIVYTFTGRRGELRRRQPSRTHRTNHTHGGRRILATGTWLVCVVGAGSGVGYSPGVRVRWTGCSPVEVSLPVARPPSCRSPDVPVSPPERPQRC